MRFEYTRAETWPALAWLARCRRRDAAVEVFHGPRVEASDDWFCEAAWAGSYPDADFDRTDLVFGSGGRVRDGVAIFVSSGSTVDRLQSIETGDAVWVSNSLPCLLAAVSGEPDPAYPRYFEDFRTIRRGLRRYRRSLATSAGEVRLTYFDNLYWDGERLIERPKPGLIHDFSSFEKYRGFLEMSLCQLAENLTSGSRRRPYRLLGTLSSGYDSPAVVVLARGCGLAEVVSFDRSRRGEPDDGAEIGSILGVRTLVVPHGAWRERALVEVPFIAADAKGEDVYFQGAEALLAGRVLLTGFHGDKVWGRDTRTLSPDLVRGDQSGLSLTEFRLRAGFIHCPVPFMAARQIRAINAISRSPAMAPWDLPTDYSRPICRRLVEEAGVPRHLFGMRKRAASVLLYERETFLSPDSLTDYLGWLDERSGEWHRPRRTLRPAALAASRFLRGLAETAPRGMRLLRSAAGRLSEIGRREDLFRYVFPWAVDRAKVAYLTVSPAAGKRVVADVGADAG